MKKGFTLAETLIVLAIIGVVASLTIPAVVRSTTQDQYISALKKANSSLSQLVSTAVTERGTISKWTTEEETGEVDADGKPVIGPLGTSTFFERYFLPHLDVNQDCGTGTGCFAASREYKNLTVKGSSCIDMDKSKDYYKIILADGTSLAFKCGGDSGNTCATTSTTGPVGQFYVDINGPKDPNLCGRDMFLFEVYPYTNNVKPYGIYSSSEAYKPDLKYRKVSSAEPECASSGAKGCAAKVLKEGAMNY